MTRHGVGRRTTTGVGSSSTATAPGPRDHAQVVRVNAAEVRQLKPVHGPLDVRPVAASVMPRTGPAIKPPAAIQARPVVATRPPKDLRPILREHGLVSGPETPAAVAP